MKPQIVCSILETTPERSWRRIEAAPAAPRLLEIRGDHLRGTDLADLVRRSGREVVATVRTVRDGGAFSGSEEERRKTLEGALAAGARWVDVEIDGPLAVLATGAAAGRTILSRHGGRCQTAPLVECWRRMAAMSKGVLKIVPDCDSADRIGAIRDLLRAAGGGPNPLVAFAMGRAGALSRLLAPSWGSWATYGSPEHGSESAPGQFPAADLAGVYDVLAIGGGTRRFALVGRDVFGSPSPAMHRAGYEEIGLDARYLPLEVERFEECLPLVGAGGVAAIEGLAVTMPFKEEAARRAARLDEVARRSGAVNTLLVDDAGAFHGFNTDGPALLDLVRSRLDPRGRSAAVVGAGGTARAAAAVLADAGACVTLYNRSTRRGAAAASALGVRSEPLARLAAADWDLLVQATPLGRGGERVVDAEALRGRCVVDAVYGVVTPLQAEARARGLHVIDGLDLLVEQAVLQFALMTGRRAGAEGMRAAARRWLDARGGSPDSVDAAPGPR